jgi:hypothetical protein
MAAIRSCLSAGPRLPLRSDLVASRSSEQVANWQPARLAQAGGAASRSPPYGTAMVGLLAPAAFAAPVLKNLSETKGAEPAGAAFPALGWPGVSGAMRSFARKNGAGGRSSEKYRADATRTRTGCRAGRREFRAGVHFFREMSQRADTAHSEKAGSGECAPNSGHSTRLSDHAQSTRSPSYSTGRAGPICGARTGLAMPKKTTTPCPPQRALRGAPRSSFRYPPSCSSPTRPRLDRSRDRFAFADRPRRNLLAAKSGHRS